jgi:hypothetical protein
VKHCKFQVVSIRILSCPRLKINRRVAVYGWVKYGQWGEATIVGDELYLYGDDERYYIMER